MRERFRSHAAHHRTGGDEARQVAAEHRRLTLNPGHVVETAEPCTFLGYRVSRAGLAPGKKLRRRLPERVRRAARRGPQALARTLASYRALVAFG